jgi:MYXO-CTERM domain-containing protein
MYAVSSSIAAARNAGYFGPSWSPWLELAAAALVLVVVLWAYRQRRR